MMQFVLKNKKLVCKDNDALYISGAQEDELMMNCARVEPNEPQMIDSTFIKNKHIGITRFRNK